MKPKAHQCIFGCFSETAADDGKPSWFQTTPAYGEYDGGGSILDEEGEVIEGAKIVFDEQSVRKIVDQFREESKREGWPGILVDREHFSCDVEKPSDAMAWAVDVRIAEDGAIWTKWEFTPKGRELFETKTLINRSPVLRLEKTGDKLFKPYQLDSIGMTNTPHFKTLSPTAAAKAAANNNHEGESTTMDPEIIAALGLAEGATKEEVLAAIKAMKDNQAAAEAKATEAEKQKDEAEAKCRGFEADEFIAKNSAKIGDAAAFREVFMANPELAKKTVAACKEAQPSATATRIVAKSASTPVGKSDVLDGLAKCRTAKEMADYAVLHAKELAELKK